jgi:hypothetical protein
MRLEPFALERWLTAHELHVEYDIAESGIYPQTVSELLAFEAEAEREQILRHLLDLRLGYSEATGTLELRSSLAETYTNCGPENILVTTGAIEANFLLFNVLLNPGDHVIAPYPAYQQLYSVPRAIGCDVDLWQVRSEKEFRFDLDELESLVRPKTRLIVINSPHNPTGAMLSPAETQRVYDIARTVGALVLSDEAYRWLTIPGGNDPAPPMYDLGPGGISVGTLSKPFGLPGLRLGWMAAPAEITAECWYTRDYVSLSPGKLSDAWPSWPSSTVTRSSSATKPSLLQTCRAPTPGSASTQTSFPGTHPAVDCWHCCATTSISPPSNWRTNWQESTVLCLPRAPPLGSSIIFASASGKNPRFFRPVWSAPAPVLPTWRPQAWDDSALSTASEAVGENKTVISRHQALPNPLL